MSKPSNYYDMDYDQRRAWDRANCDREDLEYERDRSERRASHARQCAEDARCTMRQIQHEAANQAEEYDTALDELRETVEVITAERNDLLAVSQGALGYLMALPEPHRPDEQWFTPLRAAIAKATGQNDNP